MPEIKDKGYDLAVSHWVWLLKWQEQAYLDAFQHGYKHGKEDKEEDKTRGDCVANTPLP
jgi:hypothetical protein